VEILARKANLSKIPRVKFSRNGEIAHAGLKGNVTISLKWLRKWERSEIEENQVDAVLTHTTVVFAVQRSIWWTTHVPPT
jgi:hypothetical protein